MTAPIIFQNDDGRIVFAIPYEDDFTLIGTTDLDYAGDPAVRGDHRSGDRLSAAPPSSAYVETPISRGDVVWSYSGRPPAL